MTAILGTEKGREEVEGENPLSGGIEGAIRIRMWREREDSRRARMIQTDNANSRPTNDVLAALFFRLRARWIESGDRLRRNPKSVAEIAGEPGKAGNRHLTRMAARHLFTLCRWGGVAGTAAADVMEIDGGKCQVDGQKGGQTNDATRQSSHTSKKEAARTPNCHLVMQQPASSPPRRPSLTHLVR